MFRKSIVVRLFLMTVVVSLSLTISALSSSSLSLRGRATESKVTQEQATRLEAELLVLRAEGFHPREITRPAGQFLLVIQNHSAAEETSVTLTEVGELQA